MAANYHRIKPVDPIWYRRHNLMQIRCSCGRVEALRIGDFAKWRGLPPTMRLYELVLRLRCQVCGARPTTEFE